MQSKWIQRLTLGLAATALFVAAGGPTYAASKINGKNIKSKSITGSKLKSNTLTGTQVNESKLGKVPSASSADSATNATNATNATSVSGLTPKKISLRFTGGTPNQTVFQGGGLTITAACSAVEDISVTANTSKEDAIISWFFVAGTATDFADGDDEAALDGNGAGGRDAEFDVANTEAIAGFDNGEILNVQYQAPDGQIAQVNIQAEEDEPGDEDCSISGTGFSG